MKYLKRFNESHDEIDNIQDVVQSFLDDLDFEIKKVDDYTNNDGIYYRLLSHPIEGNTIDLIFHINDIRKFGKELLELRSKIEKLRSHLKSIGYNIHSVKNVNIGYRRRIWFRLTPNV